MCNDEQWSRNDIIHTTAAVRYSDVSYKHNNILIILH